MTKYTVGFVNLSRIGLGLRCGWKGQETQDTCRNKPENKRAQVSSLKSCEWADPFGRFRRLPVCSMLLFFQARSLHYSHNSENKSCEYEDGVICRRISSRAIVICLRSIESKIAGVLLSKIDVLFRPPRNIKKAAITLRASIGTSGNCRLRKQQ